MRYNEHMFHHIDLSYKTFALNNLILKKFHYYYYVITIFFKRFFVIQPNTIWLDADFISFSFTWYVLWSINWHIIKSKMNKVWKIENIFLSLWLFMSTSWFKTSIVRGKIKHQMSQPTKRLHPKRPKCMSFMARPINIVITFRNKRLKLFWSI